MNGPIDAEQLGRLLDEHGAPLALYASQWTDSADDCVQEALVELARQRQAPDHVVAWLYRVVKNRALNSARGARRRRERETRVMSDRFGAAEQSATYDDDDSRAAIAALQQLEVSERELVVMRIWGGLKYDEIAVTLAISVSSAHRQYERALLKLRKILETPCSKNANRQNLN